MTWSDDAEREQGTSTEETSEAEPPSSQAAEDPPPRQPSPSSRGAGRG